MRYSDDDAVSTTSHSSRSSQRERQNPSYVDRFRPNTAFEQPVAPVSGHQGPPSIPQLLSLIRSAVRPTLRKPDLNTNLQIVDIINEKKGNSPREAAMAIVGYINQQQETAVLAISVLDACVKNCGYPFHLQISRKDFLNKLVKRLPEKPPIRYSQAQTLILEQIQEWRETLCRTSKHKADFGFIRDMHRLLQYKGYIFPPMNREDAAVLNAPETLKTPQELEAEDREDQAAKLNELLRSGTPEDLEEANKIMKLLAGFKEQSTDYKATVAKTLDETRQKGEILEEMVNSTTSGDQIDKNDVFSELSSSLRSALPKVLEIAESQQEEDSQASEKCHTLYNYISTVVRKYDMLVQGDVEGAQSLPIDSLASGRLRNAPKKSLIDSLIDIDGDEFTPTPSSNQPSSGDLLGLDFGGLTLGGGASSAGSSVPSTSSADLSDIFGASRSSSSSNPAPVANTAASSLDTFGQSSSSAVPASTNTGTIVEGFSDESVDLKFKVSRSADTTVTVIITNPSSKKISNLVLEIASTKSRPVTLGSISGNQMDSGSGSITQTCSFNGTEPVKFRWRLSFKSGISDVTQNGTQSNL